jgi:hypothetical protein
MIYWRVLLLEKFTNRFQSTPSSIQSWMEWIHMLYPRFAGDHLNHNKDWLDFHPSDEMEDHVERLKTFIEDFVRSLKRLFRDARKLHEAETQDESSPLYRKMLPYKFPWKDAYVGIGIADALDIFALRPLHRICFKQLRTLFPELLGSSSPYTPPNDSIRSEIVAILPSDSLALSPAHFRAFNSQVILAMFAVPNLLRKLVESIRSQYIQEDILIKEETQRTFKQYVTQLHDWNLLLLEDVKASLERRLKKITQSEAGSDPDVIVSVQMCIQRVETSIKESRERLVNVTIGPIKHWESMGLLVDHLYRFLDAAWKPIAEHCKSSTVSWMQRLYEKAESAPRDLLSHFIDVHDYRSTFAPHWIHFPDYNIDVEDSWIKRGLPPPSPPLKREIA